jgi:glycosyltransferase involved in cell wall biosynthesis
VGSATFSAIVPNYDEAGPLARCLEALAAQTVPFDEVLVIDDGSSDDSVAVARRWTNSHPGWRLLQNPRNQGVIATLDRGLREASGDFVLMGSSNDTYHPRLVEWCAEAVGRHPAAAVVTGNAVTWDDRLGKATATRLVGLPQRPTGLSPDELVAALQRSASLVTSGFVVRRDRALAMGGLHPELRWYCDWFLFHLLAFSGGYAFVPQPFATIHTGQGGRFSAGRFDWTQERQVLRALLRSLNSRPELATMFRRAAVLPGYDLRLLGALADPELRWMLTPLLVWRLTVHSLGRSVQPLLPESLLNRLRVALKV